MEDVKLRESRNRANKTLVGCILVIAMELGTLTTLSNYIGGLCEKFGASVTQVVLIFSIASMVSLICNLISAVAIEKVPAKLLVLIGSIGYILFFAAVALGSSITILYVGAACFGVGQTFACFTALQPIITWWHVDNVGKKISFLSIAYCLAGFIFNLLIARAIKVIGFQSTFIAHGVITGTIMILCTVFLISNQPESYGLKPHGYKDITGGTGGYTASGLTVAQSFKTFTFWGIIIASICCGIGATGYVNSASLIYQDMGMDAVGAGNMMSIYSVMAIIWNFAYGAISDKLSPRKANFIFCAFSAAVFLIAAFMSGTAGCILIAVTFGAGTFNGMLAAVTFPPLYGTKAVGTLIAIGMVATSIGSMVAPIISSAMYEKTGSFSSFLFLGGILFAVALILIAVGTSKAAVAKIKAVSEQSAK